MEIKLQLILEVLTALRGAKGDEVSLFACPNSQSSGYHDEWYGRLVGEAIEVRGVATDEEGSTAGRGWCDLYKTFNSIHEFVAWMESEVETGLSYWTRYGLERRAKE